MSVRLPLAFLLGVATAVLVACGGSNKKLLPAVSADRLKNDLVLVGRIVPKDGDTELAVSPLSIQCPQCRARLGQQCTRSGHPITTPHAARIRVANGGPAHDPAEQQAADERRIAAAAHLARLTDDERAELAAFEQQMKTA